MSNGDSFADPPPSANTRAELPAGAKYAGNVLEIGPMVPEMLEAGVLVLFGEQAPAELREISIVHNGQQLAEPVVPGDVLVLGDLSCAITAVGGMANDNLAQLGHIVIKANGASESELPGEISVESIPLRVPAIGATLAILTAATYSASEQTSASTSSTRSVGGPAADERPGPASTTLAIKQRRSPWGFLSAWRSSRRRGSRSA